MKHILLAAVLFFNIQANETETGKPLPSLVTTSVAKEGIVNSVQNYVGTLYYDRNSDLASESSGVVSKLHAKEGQKVNRGDVLVELESSILEAKIKAKEAILNSFLSKQTKQQRDLKRAEALLKKKSISQSSYDQTYYTLESLSSEIESHRAELLSMQIELQKRSIKAPFSGIIAKRDIDMGEWVSVGSSVFTIVDPNSIEARLNIPSKLIYTLKKNQQFQARVNSQDLDVSLKSILPMADKTSRTFPVELSLKTNMKYIEGMRIDIKVPTLKEEKAILVPRDAVIKRFGSFVLFSVVDGKAMMVPVNVISYTKNQAAIRAKGLKAGMKVITKGNERVFPNMPVVEKAE